MMIMHLKQTKKETKNRCAKEPVVDLGEGPLCEQEKAYFHFPLPPPPSFSFLFSTREHQKYWLYKARLAGRDVSIPLCIASKHE